MWERYCATNAEWVNSFPKPGSNDCSLLFFGPVSFSLGALSQLAVLRTKPSARLPLYFHFCLLFSYFVTAHWMWVRFLYPNPVVGFLLTLFLFRGPLCASEVDKEWREGTPCGPFPQHEQDQSPGKEALLCVLCCTCGNVEQGVLEKRRSPEHVALVSRGHRCIAPAGSAALRSPGSTMVAYGKKFESDSLSSDSMIKLFPWMLRSRVTHSHNCKQSERQ